MIILENDKLRLGLDETGRIVSFENKAAGKANIIESPADGAFFLVLDNSETQCKENLVWANAQDIRVGKVTDTTASFVMDSLFSSMKIYGSVKINSCKSTEPSAYHPGPHA